MSEKQIRPPLPPFTRETAIEKVRLAEDGWNSRDAEISDHYLMAYKCESVINTQMNNVFVNHLDSVSVSLFGKKLV
nr:DUF1348 family protein [Pantoea alhagi]